MMPNVSPTGKDGLNYPFLFQPEFVVTEIVLQRAEHLLFLVAKHTI